MKVKISRWGNSLAVRIPSHIVQEVALEEGEVVGIEAVGRELHIMPETEPTTLDALAYVKESERKQFLVTLEKSLSRDLNE